MNARPRSPRVKRVLIVLGAVVASASLVVGALFGISALRAGQARADLARAAAEPHAPTSDDLVGEWRGTGPWLHHSTVFTAHGWSSASGCAASSGTWSIGESGAWTSTHDAVDGDCSAVRTTDGSAYSDPSMWIEAADEVELAGDRLTFLAGGDTLGVLIKVDPDAIPERVDDASDAILGSWIEVSSGLGISFARSASDWNSGDLSVGFDLACSDFPASASGAAVGDALTIDHADGWSGDCGHEDPLPVWVASVRHYRVADADHVVLTDAAGADVVSLERHGAIPALPVARELTGLPHGATPAGEDIEGTWVLEHTDATEPQTLTIRARSYSATSADRCHPQGGAFAIDTAGHWSTGGYSAMTAIYCEPDDHAGPFASLATDAASVGMVGDRLTFFDQFGDVIVDFVRK